MENPADTASRTPLSIYVVFHPASAEARALARTLHDWFRLKGNAGDGTEAGLPLWYRAAVAGVGRQSGLQPGVPWAEADYNAVIVLADDDLVADSRWRHAMDDLAGHFAPPAGTRRRPRDRILLPVELSPSLYRLPFLVQHFNAVRLGGAIRAEDRARVLRRGVTEALVRELRAERARALAPEPGAENADEQELPKRLTVFLSHAKADGAKIAEALRDGLQGSGQLRAWYDSNDLPQAMAGGRPWSRRPHKTLRR
ncbi:MAG: hypothetical protein AAF628_22065 [Planctomycetota bacterium]